MSKDICVLCNEPLADHARSPLWTKGNNAEPLADGQCCDRCNDKVVEKRVEMMYQRNMLSAVQRHRGKV
jgi:hypothetical protein